MEDKNGKMPNLVKLTACTKEGKQALILMIIGLIGTVIVALIGKWKTIPFLLMAIPGFLAMAATQQFAMIGNSIRMSMENDENKSL